MEEIFEDGFKPNAKDGDKDGLVQDGTEWERPVEEVTVRPAKKTANVTEDRVAVYSSKNLFWYGVGELKAGYSILSKEDADKWLAKSNRVRLATPEEVAKHYGK